MSTTTARRARLGRLTDDRGRFRVLALDHRDSLRAVVGDDPEDRRQDEGLRTLKAALVTACRDVVSGVMLDPELGMTDEVLAALGDDLGFMAPLEEQGYLADPSVTHTTVPDDWGPAAAAAAGAAAVKLLVLWDGDGVDAQRAVIEASVAAARAAGVPLVLEPLPRGFDSHGPWVLDWAAHHSDSGADVFKLPYPGSVAGCERLTELLPAPWVLLSAGVGFEEFLGQVETAIAAGAQGYMVGRAVWREAATLDVAARDRAIEELVVPRLQRLARVGA